VNRNGNFPMMTQNTDGTKHCGVNARNIFEHNHDILVKAINNPQDTQRTVWHKSL